MNSFFFFSSRRRHTRLQGDWSSDVCSSDLSALLHAGAARLASGTHDVLIAALEMQIELLGATHLSDHTKFWETEQRFETMEIPAHGFLRLVVFFWRGLSRILRGILRLSISGSQPLAIDLRHWPQIWRRAPLFIFEGTSHALVTAYLRPGTRPSGAENAMILVRLL